MTAFIDEFNNRIKNKDFDVGFEVGLYDSYLIEEVENRYWLIQKFFEYNKNDGDIKYYILIFIKYLGDNNCFDNGDVLKYLKENIRQYLNTKIGEFDYFVLSLKSVFAISRDDALYFSNLFNEFVDHIGKNNYLLSIFLRIFKDLKESETFFECAILLLKSERRVFYEYDIWKYLVDLSDDEFKRYFLKILELFTNENEKKFLDDFGTYVGLINYSEKNGKNLKYEKENKKIIDDLMLRVYSISITKLEKKIIENFIFSEIDYISFKYQSIERNYFDMNLFLFLKSSDNNILYKCLKHTNLRNISFSNPEFIYSQLNNDNLIKCLKLYENKRSYFYGVYQLIKSHKRDDLIDLIKKVVDFWNELLLIEKQANREQEKWKKHEIKRIRGWKKRILDLTHLEENEGYYPQLLQEYYDFIRHGEEFKHFSNKELASLNGAVKRQSFSCLNSLHIADYLDEKIKNIVVYEETGEGSHSVSWYVHYLYWILNISEYLNFDISNYYKSFVLVYPLLFGDESQNKFLAYFSGKINREDIDYVLKVYSEDLHENAIGLRYYVSNGLCRFYEKFKRKFSTEQKEKFRDILLDFIQSEKVIYKDEFIEKYAEVVDKNTFKKIYKEPTYNYFKSILSNEISISEVERLEYKKQLKINELLITKFNDKHAMLWRIQQIMDGVVKFDNPNVLEQGEYTGRVHAVSLLENELEFWHNDERSFGYYVERKSPINIKKNMLEVFELGLKIQQDIKYGIIESGYKSYSTYLIRLFYGYIDNLKKIGLSSLYYKKIIRIINKYPDNDLNIAVLKKKFGVVKSHYRSLNSDNIDLGMSVEIGIENGENIINKRKKELKILNMKKSDLIHQINILEFKKEKVKTCVNTLKNIVIVEGETDKIILENAWNKLNPEINHNFLITYAKGCKNLASLLNDFANGIYNGFLKGDLKDINKIIGIFDFDYEGFYAYSQMLLHKGLSKFERITDSDTSTGLTKCHKNGKIYAILLPIPNSKKYFAYEELDSFSMIEIENLFEDDVFRKFIEYLRDKDANCNIEKKIKSLLLPNSVSFYSIQKDGKSDFADYTQNLDVDEFKNFEVLFKKIEYIIGKE